jgi:dolichol-phosphate mannosyltransferase
VAALWHALLPMTSKMPEHRVLWREPALLLAGVLILLKAVYLPWIDLYPEEAYYWNFAQHLDIGYLDHPPLVAWLMALSTKVLGQTGFGVRFFALVCSLITSCFAYHLADLWHGRRAAAVAALLVQILPFFWMTGWIMTPDAPLTACWAGLLYFLARVFFDGAGRGWVGVGVCLGLGLLAKYSMVLPACAALLFMVLDRPGRAWFRRWEPLAAVVLAFLIFSPVVYWNATHHWASFIFQSTRRLQERHYFGLPLLLGSVLLLLTPLGLVLAARIWWEPAPVNEPEANRRRFFLGIGTAVPLAVFVLFSLTHRTKLNWTGPIWLALVPALADQLTRAAQPLAAYLVIGWRTTAAVLLVLYLGLFRYLTYGLPGLGYAGNIELLPIGWSSLGYTLECQQQELRRRMPGHVLIVGMDRDFIASEAAFYHSRRPSGAHEVTGAHLFNIASLMYAYWSPAAEADGATLVLASFKREALDEASVRRRCAALDPIEEHALTVHGKPVCRYYTRIVYDYHSYRRRSKKPVGSATSHPLN